ncbi:glycosyltransferase family 4 protein [Neorhizobium galegae]|uniref:glycosyltransferase family 4 protein n=1 Tax=Neorhizobium galegae TaxID=399 RepID=UPI002104F0BB|nr:glycosyltransferase family 4 protein [Neorhizobium galegae]MCQ1835331.1 glycosyltransferase family 4 protein [Neorhizobium galegae]UIY28986.1 glycosyltransferase family 4 protein [Neorhizobium galegae]
MAAISSQGWNMSSIDKVLIVAEHASLKFGGEASLPWHYFTRLRARGIETWLVVHERTREELTSLAPDAVDHMHFIKDTWLNILMWKLGRHVPDQIANITVGYISRIATQMAARRITRELVHKLGIQVVHQPIPVSPREPSLIVNVGAPVVIGPMNGNMSYPPGVHPKGRTSGWGDVMFKLGRRLSDGMHLLMRGKREAALLLAANERTRAVLPTNIGGSTAMLVENGIDVELWTQRSYADDLPGKPVRFVYLGRLVDWKAADLLLLAFGRVKSRELVELDIVGDGPMRSTLEAVVQAMDLVGRVRFLGFLPQRECARVLQQSDVFVMPSIHECGGAVVLEAMAVGLPVIATKWGGPDDYLDDDCGVLVPPTSRDDIVAGFAEAMQRLSDDVNLRRRLGEAGRAKALRHFDWDDKITQIIQLYAVAIKNQITAAEDEDVNSNEREKQIILNVGGK